MELTRRELDLPPTLAIGKKFSKCLVDICHMVLGFICIELLKRNNQYQNVSVRHFIRKFNQNYEDCLETKFSPLNSLHYENYIQASKK